MSEIIIYHTADNQAQVTVVFEQETVWLSQKQMAELFQKDSDTIGLHLKNIYAEAELEELSTTEFFSVVQTEGTRQVSRKIKFYNLDAFLFVWFLEKNKHRFKQSGELKINNNGLTALALLVA